MTGGDPKSSREVGRREARIVRRGGDPKLPDPAEMRRRGLKWNGYAWVPVNIIYKRGTA